MPETRSRRTDIVRHHEIETLGAELGEGVLDQDGVGPVGRQGAPRLVGDADPGQDAAELQGQVTDVGEEPVRDGVTLAPGTADGGLRGRARGAFFGLAVVLGIAFLAYYRAIFGVGSYSKLMGDFKRSPLVRDAGDKNLFFAALGVCYTV